MELLCLRPGAHPGQPLTAELNVACRKSFLCRDCNVLRQATTAGHWGSASMQVNFAYRWFCGLSIENKIPDHSAFSRAKREDGSLSREDFTFDKERNVYVCPQGKLLHTTGRVHDGETLLYRARTADCGPCPLKARCCPKAPERKSRAASMKTLAMLPVQWLTPKPSNNRGATANASRCYSPISSGS
jgi:hypothetical protein